MKKSTLILIGLMSSFSLLMAQPTLTWQNAIGGSGTDIGYSIKNTSDKGFIITGYTESSDIDIAQNKGERDCFIIKLSELGAIEWQKTYGGSKNDVGLDIKETTDGGYAICGTTESTDGDISSGKGENDFWLVKLDDQGNLEWEKTYGGSDDEVAYSLIQTDDEGFVLLGNSESTDGDITTNRGFDDIWMIKVNAAGDLVWEQSYGGSMDDQAYNFIEATDGGYLIIGSTESRNGDITTNRGGLDIWIIKTSEAGDLEWQKTYGGSGNEFGTAISNTADGGYLFTSQSDSDDFDLSENRGSGDCWIAKINDSGFLDWEKSFGGSDRDTGTDIIKTAKDNFVLSVITASSDGDLSSNAGDADIWIIELDQTGSILWEKTFGGSQLDRAHEIIETEDEEIAIIGLSYSQDGDVIDPKGDADIWVLSVRNEPSAINKTVQNRSYSIYPNPASNRVMINLAEEHVGSSYRVSNYLGQVIVDGQIHAQETILNIASMESGFYMLDIMNQNKVTSLSFIKE